MPTAPRPACSARLAAALCGRADPDLHRPRLGVLRSHRHRLDAVQAGGADDATADDDHDLRGRKRARRRTRDPGLRPREDDRDPKRCRCGTAADLRRAATAPTPTVVAVGRLQRPKDPLTLARALGRVRASFTAVIVGEGPDRPRLEAELRRLGLERPVSARRRPQRRRATCSRAPTSSSSSSTSEGLPLSILEAMAAGAAGGRLVGRRRAGGGRGR